MTGVKLLPIFNGVALHPRQEIWHDQANNPLARIHLGCCDELLPLIVDIDDSLEMWEAIRDGHFKATKILSGTRILQKFTASWPSPDEMVTPYLPKLLAFRKMLIAPTANLTNDARRTHFFTPFANSYETII
jgi:hypothetical protein